MLKFIKIKRTLFCSIFLFSLITGQISQNLEKDINKLNFNSADIHFTKSYRLQNGPYYIYLPVIKNEIEIYPGGRWPHIPDSLTLITYYWGSFLQDHNNPWRMIFTSSLGDWNNVAQKINYSWDASGEVMINTNFDDSQNAPSGKTILTFSSGTTIEANVFINTFYINYSDNIKKSVAGHELGHGFSLGHIITMDIALMGYNPNAEIYYVPQPIDIALVNRVYP